MDASGNYDRWWYNISYPHKLYIGNSLEFNLWDSTNKRLVKKAIIKINESWLNRIINASTHFYNEREICKVHILRKHSSKEFIMYFGRKKDGVYIIK
jgi:hypothetical protein